MSDLPDIVLVHGAWADGSSWSAVIGGGPPTPSLAHLIVDSHGFGWLPEDDFVEHFAVGVDPVKARVLCAVRQPISMSAFDDVMGAPAWKSHPSWYGEVEFAPLARTASGAT
jgi:hypothetical protein